MLLSAAELLINIRLIKIKLALMTMQGKFEESVTQVENLRRGLAVHLKAQQEN